MDLMLKSLIIENYKESLKNLNEITSGKRLNGFVLKPQQYLTPTIMWKSTPLEEERGEFYHYNVICETLEKLLAGEKTNKNDYTCRFRDAPEEIVQILYKTLRQN
jgi:hypothetical protein